MEQTFRRITCALSPAESGFSIHAVDDGVHHSVRPRGGDAISLAARWAWAYEVAVGEIGMLDGRVDSDSGSVTMRASATAQAGEDGMIPLDAGRATVEVVDRRQAEFIDRVEVGRRVAGHVWVAYEVADAAATTSPSPRPGRQSSPCRSGSRGSHSTHASPLPTACS